MNIENIEKIIEEGSLKDWSNAVGSVYNLYQEANALAFDKITEVIEKVFHGFLETYCVDVELYNPRETGKPIGVQYGKYPEEGHEMYIAKEAMITIHAHHYFNSGVYKGKVKSEDLIKVVADFIEGVYAKPKINGVHYFRVTKSDANKIRKVLSKAFKLKKK